MVGTASLRTHKVALAVLVVGLDAPGVAPPKTFDRTFRPTCLWTHAHQIDPLLDPILSCPSRPIEGLPLLRSRCSACDLAFEPLDQR